MKNLLKILFAVLLVVPAGCNRNEPPSTRAAGEEPKSVTDQMKEQRDTYVKSVDARLAEFDQKFDGLDERASAMTGTVKNNFNKAIDGLREERKAVESKLDDLKRVSVESWTTMKGEVDSALADLDQSYTHVSETYQKLPESKATPKPKTY